MGMDHFHYTILGLSNDNRIYSTLSEILLTFFWKKITVVQNKIIEGTILVCVDRLLNTVGRKRVNVERILIVKERISTVVGRGLIVVERISNNVEGISSIVGRISSIVERISSIV